ncbi:hypothetical protein ACLMAJ_29805 [Nocardia sp. KC 131]|uniref:hypothetical protein n=1 Tax=Nocardia arseniciresistens TaxID=3392119 RepID=UPI00398EFEA6
MPESVGAYRREYDVTAENFKVIRQLTLELANLPQEPLVRLGWSPKYGDFLKRFARSVPSKTTSPTRVRIIIINEEFDDPYGPNGSETATGGVDSAGDVVRYMPISVAELWPDLLTAAFEALGGEEARFRTGFYPDAINEALAAISGIKS